MKKKLISLILCAVLCVSAFPAAYATESAPAETAPLETPGLDAPPAETTPADDTPAPAQADAPLDPAAEPAAQDDGGAPVCICDAACAEGATRAECPVCGAEGAQPSACAKFVPPADPSAAPSAQPTPTPTPALTAADVQSLINALPGAEEITQDNRAEVENKLTAIDEARLALTDEAHDALDFTRYEAAVAALNALDGTPGASEPETLTDATASNIEKLFTSGYSEIKLIEDISGIEAGLTAGGRTTTTLDLNNHTLKSSTLYTNSANDVSLAIKNGTISDSSHINYFTGGSNFISNVAMDSVTLSIRGSSVLTLDGVNYTGEKSAIAVDGTGKLIIKSGSYSMRLIGVGNGAFVEINDGTFASEMDLRGTATIKGGTFNKDVRIFKGTISGGTFNSQTSLNAVTVSGGTFNGSASLTGSTVTGGSFNGTVTLDGSTKLSGGTYAALKSSLPLYSFLAPGCMLVSSTGDTPLDSNATELQNVKVVPSGITLKLENPQEGKILTISDTTKGVDVTLTAKVTGTSGDVKYQWYSGTNSGDLTQIAGATNSTYTANCKSNGTFYYKVMVTCGNVVQSAATTLRFSSVDISANPRDNPATYNGKEQILILSFVCSSKDYTVYWSLSKDGDFTAYSDANCPSATNAGTYTIYYYASNGTTQTPTYSTEATIHPYAPDRSLHANNYKCYYKKCDTATSGSLAVQVLKNGNYSEYVPEYDATVTLYFTGTRNTNEGGEPMTKKQLIARLNTLNVGEYYYYGLISSESGNVEETRTKPATITIEKNQPPSELYKTVCDISKPEYNGEKQVLARQKEDTTADFKIEFMTGEGYALNEDGLPVATDAGTYTVNYKLLESKNYQIPTYQLTAQASIEKRPLMVDFGEIEYGTAERFTNAVTLDATGKSITGVLPGDELTLNGNVAGKLDDIKLGERSFTVTGSTDLTVSGADAKNYTVGGGTVKIVPKAITTIFSVSVSDKTYDGKSDATITSLSFGSLPYSESLDGKYTASASFDSPDVGSRKTVTVTVTALSDKYPASNYVLSTKPGDCTAIKHANIKVKDLSISSISVKDKQYDGTDTAELDVTLSGVIEQDKDKLSATASAAFADDAVGKDKRVTVSGNITLTGEAKDNYRLSGTQDTSSLTGDITPREITVTGITAENKTYDGGTASAAIDCTKAEINGKIAGDDVSVASAVGAFASKDVVAGNSVLLSSVTLSGADKGNYVLSAESALSVPAQILPRPVTLKSDSFSKPYDGLALTNGTGGVSVVEGSMVAGETLDYSFSGSQTDVGTGQNTFTALTSATANIANYAVTYNFGALTVTLPANLDNDADALTPGTVTPDDRDKINNALEEVNGYLDMSPSDAEKATLNEKKAHYQQLLKRLDDNERAEKAAAVKAAFIGIATGDEARGKLWLGLLVLSLCLGTAALVLIKRGKKR